MPLDLEELTELLLDIRAEQAQQAIDLAVIKSKLDDAIERKRIGGILGGIGGALGAAAAAWASYKAGN